MLLWAIFVDKKDMRGQPQRNDVASCFYLAVISVLYMYSVLYISLRWNIDVCEAGEQQVLQVCQHWILFYIEVIVDRLRE